LIPWPLITIGWNGFLPAIEAPKSTLLYGEGNGRFLHAFRSQFPNAPVTLVDSSAGMLNQAEKRLKTQGHRTKNVTFIQADALSWLPVSDNYDLIVTCFFLDCFGEEQLQRLISQISRVAAPEAQWLNSDFKVASRGWQRFRSLCTLRFLYAFFSRTTHITAQRLINPDPFFTRAGFTRQARQESDGGFLYSDWWSRKSVPST
jgi:ubiquinone/menaquinone biosynthesis C-methylase UbiE